MDDLLQEFIAETRETLEALAGEIVAWEADPSDRARLDAIFRFVHTVKGSCGFLDLPRLARLSHAAEDVLAAVRAGERAADTPLVDAVLAVVDRIGEIVDAIDAGAPLDDAGEDQLLEALKRDAALPVPATVPVPSVAPRVPTRSVRLSVDLLDRMMGGMSDMVLARNELARRLRDGDADPASEAALERLSTTVADMREIVTRTRMQRIDALFSSLPRLVRDTAASAGKAVTLVMEGEDVELDREMIEMMRDPLTHMIRNAIDHGIEMPGDRRLAGKRDTGRLVVSARQSGNRIIVEVADDGRGIDTERLAAKVIAADPARAPALRAMNAAALAGLIFEPGLSSRDEATDLSGRGVGMDVVRANIEQIGGSVSLRNAPGKGLRVVVEVPLTLAILSAVTVVVGEQRFAVPRTAINELVAATSPMLRIDPLGDSRIATLRERRLPLIDLGQALGLVRDVPPGLLMVIEIAGGSYALAVDAVGDTEELVVKPAAPAVMAAGVYAGQVLPDSGCPMLLIDCAGVAQAAGIVFDRIEVQAGPVAVADAEPTEEALLFDDLDGTRRAILVSAVERIESVAVAAIGESGGRLRATIDGSLVPLIAQGTLPVAGNVAVLRLDDGDRSLGYVAREVHDLVRLPAAIAASSSPGSAGVALIDGVPIDLVEPLWLLAQADATGSVGAPRLCLLGGADVAWLRRFVRPAMEAAGYRVVDTLRAGDVPAVVLAMEDDPLDAGLAAPTVRLSRRRGEGIWRYDRAAVLAAVAAGVGA